jgi:hypothetical protein
MISFAFQPSMSAVQTGDLVRKYWAISAPSTQTQTSAGPPAIDSSRPTPAYHVGLQEPECSELCKGGLALPSSWPEIWKKMRNTIPGKSDQEGNQENQADGVLVFLEKVKYCRANHECFAKPWEEGCGSAEELRESIQGKACVGGDGKLVDKVFLVTSDEESDKCAKLGLKSAPMRSP